VLHGLGGLSSLIGGVGHMPGHATGSDLLGTALGRGMSLRTIKTYFPNLVPEAKRRIKVRKSRSKGREKSDELA